MIRTIAQFILLPLASSILDSDVVDIRALVRSIYKIVEMCYFVKENTSSVLVIPEIVLICSWILLCRINRKVQGVPLIEKEIAEGDFTISLQRIAECFHSSGFSWGWGLAPGALVWLIRFVAAYIRFVAVWTALYLQIWSVHLAQASFKGGQTLIHRFLQATQGGRRCTEAPTSSCRIFVA